MLASMHIQSSVHSFALFSNEQMVQRKIGRETQSYQMLSPCFYAVFMQMSRILEMNC